MWKDIKGYEGLYQISDSGEVRRLCKGGGTRTIKHREGQYPTVSLSRNGKPKSYSVHRLVAEHFLERKEGQDEVNHKDGNKWNNRADNLEWVSQRENLLHAMANLKHFPFGKAPRKVRCIDKDTGEVVTEFYSIAEAARVFGKAGLRTSITMCCQGLQQTAYGYRWEYAD